MLAHHGDRRLRKELQIDTIGPRGKSFGLAGAFEHTGHYVYNGLELSIESVDELNISSPQGTAFALMNGYYLESVWYDLAFAYRA